MLFFFCWIYFKNLNIHENPLYGAVDTMQSLITKYSKTVRSGSSHFNFREFIIILGEILQA